MAKQYYIDENGNAIPVSGTINTAQMLPLTSSPTSPTTADAIGAVLDGYVLKEYYGNMPTAVGDTLDTVDTGVNKAFLIGAIVYTSSRWECIPTGTALSCLNFGHITMLKKDDGTLIIRPYIDDNGGLTNLSAHSYRVTCLVKYS